MYIKDNKLNNNVKLCGNVDDIENILKDKKGFILSSKYEGMPNALMEAYGSRTSLYFYELSLWWAKGVN